MKNMKLYKILKFRNIALLSILAGIVLVLFFIWLFGNDSPIITIFSILPIAGFIGLIIVGFTHCPYCKKHFFSAWFYSNIFTNKCVHCSKGVNDDAL